MLCFFFQAEDGIRDDLVTGVQTCALPIFYAFFLGRSVEAVEKKCVDGGEPRRQLRGVQVPALVEAVDERVADLDPKRGVEGKSGDLGGRRIIKKKKGAERWR